MQKQKQDEALMESSGTSEFLRATTGYVTPGFMKPFRSVPVMKFYGKPNMASPQRVSINKRLEQKKTPFQHKHRIEILRLHLKPPLEELLTYVRCLLNCKFTFNSIAQKYFLNSVPKFARLHSPHCSSPYCPLIRVNYIAD